MFEMRLFDVGVKEGSLRPTHKLRGTPCLAFFHWIVKISLKSGLRHLIAILFHCSARAAKAAAVFPRPSAGPLRPVVRGQTVKYNSKRREGRGFTLEELKEAGIPAKMARTIGIAVDHRRRNRSLEGLQENVNRLKAYKSNLVVFPRRANKPKSGDSSVDELKAVEQLKGKIMPIVEAKPALEKIAVTDAMKAEKAYATLRLERMNARMAGIRKKRAEEAEKEEKDA